MTRIPEGKNFYSFILHSLVFSFISILILSACSNSSGSFSPSNDFYDYLQQESNGEELEILNDDSTRASDGFDNDGMIIGNGKEEEFPAPEASDPKPETREESQLLLTTVCQWVSEESQEVNCRLQDREDSKKLPASAKIEWNVYDSANNLIADEDIQYFYYDGESDWHVRISVSSDYSDWQIMPDIIEENVLLETKVLSKDDIMAAKNSLACPFAQVEEGEECKNDRIIDVTSQLNFPTVEASNFGGDYNWSNIFKIDDQNIYFTNTLVENVRDRDDATKICEGLNANFTSDLNWELPDRSQTKLLLKEIDIDDILISFVATSESSFWRNRGENQNNSNNKPTKVFCVAD